MNNIRRDDRRCFTLGMELPPLLDFPEQLRGSEKINYGPSQITRALARWENEGGRFDRERRVCVQREMMRREPDRRSTQPRFNS